MASSTLGDGILSGITLGMRLEEDDREHFWLLAAVFCSSMALFTLLAGCCIGYRSRWRLDRVGSCTARCLSRPDKAGKDSTLVCRWRIVVFLAWIVLIMPLLLALTWGIWTAITVSPFEIGVGIATVFPAVFFLLLGFALWRSRHWRLRRQRSSRFTEVVLFFALAALLLIGFEMVVVFTGDYSFMASSWAFLGLNLLLTALSMFALYSPPSYDRAQSILELVRHHTTGAKDSSGAVKPYHFTTSSGQNRALAWYAAAILTLLTYGLINFVLADEHKPEDGRWLGLLITDAILFWDICCGFLIFGGTLRSPGALSIVSGIVRILFIIFGARFWLLGASAAYLVAGIFIVYLAVEDWMTRVMQHRNAEALLLSKTKAGDSRLAHALYSHPDGGRQTALAHAGATPHPMKPVQPEDISSVLRCIASPWLLLVFLSALFAGLVAFVEFGDPSGVPVDMVQMPQSTHSQTEFGVVALVLVLMVYLPAYSVYAYYRAKSWRLGCWGYFVCILVYAIIAGGTVLLHFLTDSIVVLATGLFAPIALMSFWYMLHHWASRDYHVLPTLLGRNPFRVSREPVDPPASHRKIRADVARLVRSRHGAGAGAGAGVGVGGSTGAVATEEQEEAAYEHAVIASKKASRQSSTGEQLALLALFAFVLSLLGFSLMVSLLVDPAWFGWAVSGVLLLLVTTGVSITHWFHTFHVTAFMVINCVLAVLIYLALHVTAAWQFYDEHDNHPLAWTIISALLYPAAVLILISIIVIRDEAWDARTISAERQASLNVMVIFSQLLIIAAICVAGFLLDHLEIAGSLLVAYVVFALLVAFQVKWAVNEYYLPPFWRMLEKVLMLLFVLAGVVLAVVYSAQGKTTIAMGWSTVTIAFIVVALLLTAATQRGAAGAATVFYSDHVFPAIYLDPATDGALPANKPLLLVLAAILIAYLWGVWGTLVFTPKYLGLFVCAITKASAAALCIYVVRTSQRAFVDAVETLRRSAEPNRLLRIATLAQQRSLHTRQGTSTFTFDQDGIHFSPRVGDQPAIPLVRNAEQQLNRLFWCGSITQDQLGPSFLWNHGGVDATAAPPTPRTPYGSARPMALSPVSEGFPTGLDDRPMHSGLAVSRLAEELHFLDAIVNECDEDEEFVKMQLAYDFVHAAKTEVQQQRTHWLAFLRWVADARNLPNGLSEADLKLVEMLAGMHYRPADRRANTDTEMVAMWLQHHDYDTAAEYTDTLCELRSLYNHHRELIAYEHIRVEAAEMEAAEQRDAAEKQEADSQTAAVESRIQELYAEGQECSATEVQLENDLAQIKEAAAAATREGDEAGIAKAAREAGIVEAKLEEVRARGRRVLEERNDAMARTNAAAQASRPRTAMKLHTRQSDELVNSQIKRMQVDLEGKWVDTSFEGAAALGSDFAGMSIDWRQAADITVSEPIMIASGCCAGDIRQGGLDNGWLARALTVVAQEPSMLDRVLITKAMNKHGIYGVRLFRNDRWNTVLVDERLPVQVEKNHAGETVQLHPMYTSGAVPVEMWVCLVEKAFAKLHGSYSRLRGGWVSEALQELTGETASVIRLWTDETRQQVDDGSLFKKLHMYRDLGYILGCGTPFEEGEGSREVQWAFTIPRIEEQDGHMLIQVHNPHGHHKWVGDWSELDTVNWTTRMRKKLAFEPDEDNADGATVWMCMADFVETFAHLFVCRPLVSKEEGGPWFRHVVEGAWSLPGPADALTETQIFAACPQFLIAPAQHTIIVVTLIQTDENGYASSNSSVQCIIGAGHGKRLKYTPSGINMVTTIQSDAAEVTTEVRLAPRDHSYTIALQPTAGMKGNYTLVIHTQDKLMAPLRRSSAAKNASTDGSDTILPKLRVDPSKLAVPMYTMGSPRRQSGPPMTPATGASRAALLPRSEMKTQQHDAIHDAVFSAEEAEARSSQRNLQAEYDDGASELKGTPASSVANTPAKSVNDAQSVRSASATSTTTRHVETRQRLVYEEEEDVVRTAEAV